MLLVRKKHTACSEEPRENNGVQDTSGATVTLWFKFPFLISLALYFYGFVAIRWPPWFYTLGVKTCVNLGYLAYGTFSLNPRSHRGLKGKTKITKFHKTDLAIALFYEGISLKIEDELGFSVVLIQDIQGALCVIVVFDTHPTVTITKSRGTLKYGVIA